MQSTSESQSQHGPTVSRSSILGLDLLTFLIADVRDGVGPYLSVFLKGGLHWQSGEIGIDMPDKSGIDKNAQRPDGSPHRWLTSVGIGWHGPKWRYKQCFSDEVNTDRMRLN